jgi:GTPase
MHSFCFERVNSSDFACRQPAHDFDIILAELASFSDALVAKPMIVVASKIDACQDPARIEAVRAKAAEHGLPFQTLSAVTGQGIEELRFAVSEQLFPATDDATISVGS